MKRVYKTKSKIMIETLLQNNPEKSFSAMDVFSFITSTGMSTNLSTVYRNLEKMVSGNELIKFKSANDEYWLYQFIEKHSNCSEHLHLQCSNCERIFHMECDFIDEISEHLRKHHSFELEYNSSILMGTCDRCKSQLTNGGEK